MADLIMLRSENTRLEAETIESAAILEKAVKESKAIVAGYNRAIEERDAARAELANLRDVVKRETLNLEYLANWFDLDPDYRTRLERLRDAVETIRAAIGIESEAPE